MELYGCEGMRSSGGRIWIQVLNLHLLLDRSIELEQSGIIAYAEAKP